MFVSGKMAKTETKKWQMFDDFKNCKKISLAKEKYTGIKYKICKYITKYAASSVQYNLYL